MNTEREIRNLAESKFDYPIDYFKMLELLIEYAPSVAKYDVVFFSRKISIVHIQTREGTKILHELALFPKKIRFYDIYNDPPMFCDDKDTQLLVNYFANEIKTRLEREEELDIGNVCLK